MLGWIHVLLIDTLSCLCHHSTDHIDMAPVCEAQSRVKVHSPAGASPRRHLPGGSTCTCLCHVKYVDIYSSCVHRADSLRYLHSLEKFRPISRPCCIAPAHSQAVMSALVLSGPNDPMASLIELELIFIPFYGCIDDLLSLASNEQITVQALAELVGCGEMWQAILRRQLERDCHVDRLLDYVNNGAASLVTMEEAEVALQLALRILTDDGLQLLDIKRKLGNGMYVS